MCAVWTIDHVALGYGQEGVLAEARSKRRPANRRFFQHAAGRFCVARALVRVCVCEGEGGGDVQRISILFQFHMRGFETLSEAK